MLEDWERRELAIIETELRADAELARVLAPPGRLERHLLAFRRHFYPRGFLVCAIVYMVIALEGAFTGTLIQAALLGAVAWVAIALSAADGWRFLRNSAVAFWDR
jgi:hypothetical protein